MNKKFLGTCAVALAAFTVSTTVAFADEVNTTSTPAGNVTTTVTEQPVVTGDGTVNASTVDTDTKLEVPTNTVEMTKEGVVNGTNADTTKEATSGLAHSNTDYPEGVQAGTWADTSKPEENPAQAKWKQTPKKDGETTKEDAAKKSDAATKQTSAAKQGTVAKAESKFTKGVLPNTGESTNVLALVSGLVAIALASFAKLKSKFN